VENSRAGVRPYDEYIEQNPSQGFAHERSVRIRNEIAGK
jgi:hypothetical protein